MPIAVPAAWNSTDPLHPESQKPKAESLRPAGLFKAKDAAGYSGIWLSFREIKLKNFPAIKKGSFLLRLFKGMKRQDGQERKMGIMLGIFSFSWLKNKDGDYAIINL